MGYNIMPEFCKMNSAFKGIFLGFCFSESIFWGFSVGGKVFFWVVQKYLTPLILSVGLSSLPPGLSRKYGSKNVKGKSPKNVACKNSIPGGRGGGHTSISLIGMLVREQISTTQKK